MKYVLISWFLALSFFSCSNSGNQDEKSVTTTSSEAVSTNTIIVDVRTTEEWDNDGHAACSVNYPLDIFQTKIDSLKKFDKVVLVCRSGNRANTALHMLEDAGFKEVVNMGPWQNVVCK